MFSILIPLFNKKQFVCRALDAVFGQHFKDFEVIVVDDGSTDGGGNLVEGQYGKMVKLIRQENKGVSQARNKGIQEARYPYIAFLDADDYWHPNYLSFLSRVIEENPEVGIIGCHYDPIQLENEPKLSYFRLENYFKDAVYNTRFFTSATCIKKEFFEIQPGFDPDLRLGEDIDVWLRASLYFGDGIYIQNTLVYYSQEDSSGATGKSYSLDQTLIPKLLGQKYFSDSIGASTCTMETFIKFQSKWVYLNLFPHFVRNHIIIKEVLSRIPRKYFFIHTFYALPSSWMKVFFSKKKLSSLFRNYIKFCFRYIYTS
ncbi:Glycosyl transferase-like protein [Lunatimonas lonarensis]|uniref:Glycosyl transferase-like protein n=1 Tax=Lunatimonas lonarensis TaxID=1232681 RepID=R7ZZ35_9BACT|nr:glycosyltransferase family A protein [Lunatimonas lonarensis]EON79308.1 Glycosyl transferase-like protein [Lunatimonas lonarensis]